VHRTIHQSRASTADTDCGAQGAFPHAQKQPSHITNVKTNTISQTSRGKVNIMSCTFQKIASLAMSKISVTKCHLDSKLPRMPTQGWLAKQSSLPVVNKMQA